MVESPDWHPVDVIPGPDGSNLEIRARMDGNPVVVLLRAELFGPLAVHHTWARGEGEEPWTVTHIRTGMCAFRFPSRRLALDFVEQAKHLDWDFDDGDRIPRRTREAVCKLLEGR